MTYLEAVVAALRSLIALTDGMTVAELGADDMRLRAVERYWVLAGNAAKAHAHTAGLSAGVDPGPAWQVSATPSPTIASTRSTSRCSTTQPA